MAAWVAPAIAAGGTLAGGIISSIGQAATNAMNRNNMREERNWTEMMSNTAHQREVADLAAAGLNPILSAGGSGASTPNAPMATMQNELEGLGQGVGGGARSGVEAYQRGREVDQALQVASSQIELNRANAEVSSANARQINARLPLAELESNFWKMVAEGGTPLLKWLTDMVKSKVEGVQKNGWKELVPDLPNLGVVPIPDVPQSVKDRVAAASKALRDAGQDPWGTAKRVLGIGSYNTSSDSSHGGVSYGGLFSGRSLSDLDKRHYGDTGNRFVDWRANEERVQKYRSNFERSGKHFD